MKLGLFLLMSVGLNIFLLGAEPSSSDLSQFNLDKDLVNSLYQDAVTESKIESARSGSDLRVHAQFSYLVPTAMSLSNQYFDVQYLESFSTLPGVDITVSQGFWEWRAIRVAVSGRTGFYRKDSLSTVLSKSGASFRDMIQLSRIPIAAGLRADFRIFNKIPFRPYVEASVGIQWFYQSGKLDKAIEQGFWIPFYQGGVGINLFDSEVANDWFGGLDVAGSIQRSANSTQVAESWALNLGVTLNL